jgi:hypothetical protein
MLKESALGYYKHDLRQVSHQTIQDRAVCKTQAENVFMDCLTEAADVRIEQGSARVRQHEDAANGGSGASFGRTFWFVLGGERRCVRCLVGRGSGLMLC